MTHVMQTEQVLRKDSILESDVVKSFCTLQMDTTDYPETLHPVCQTKNHSVTIAEESNVLSLSASVSTFFLPPPHFLHHRLLNFRSICILKSTPSFCTNGTTPEMVNGRSQNVIL